MLNFWVFCDLFSVNSPNTSSRKWIPWQSLLKANFKITKKQVYVFLTERAGTGQWWRNILREVYDDSKPLVIFSTSKSPLQEALTTLYFQWIIYHFILPYCETELFPLTKTKLLILKCPSIRDNETYIFYINYRQ